MNMEIAYAGLVIFIIGYVVAINTTWDNFSLGYLVGGFVLTVGMLIGCLII